MAVTALYARRRDAILWTIWPWDYELGDLSFFLPTRGWDEGGAKVLLEGVTLGSFGSRWFVAVQCRSRILSGCILSKDSIKLHTRSWQSCVIHQICRMIRKPQESIGDYWCWRRSTQYRLATTEDDCTGMRLWRRSWSRWNVSKTQISLI